MKNYIDENGIEIQRFYPTQYKLVKSGCLLEIYKFGKDIILGQKPKRIRDKEELENLISYPKMEPNHEEVLKSSARRAKRNIKRLIYANSFKWLKKNNKPYQPITLTLTFKDNIINLKAANYEFTKFIRRLNYETNRIEGKKLKQSNLKYLAVFEQQERGAIHYHMIFFNLPYIENIYDKLRDIWGQGRIMVGGKRKFEKIRNQLKLKKIIDYFIKYILKSIMENNFPNQKKYIASKGLLKPQTQYFEEVIKIVQNQLPDDTLVYKWDGEQEYLDGKESKNFLRWMNYWQYDLSALPELENEIDKMLCTYS
ncbi:MAG: hypothetical protein WC349_04520 [Patescibacteria group bacterium]|jgi:hypothetical protein